MPSFVSKLRSALRAFSAARSGNVAITFAFATLPMIGMVGASVDYSRANSVKAAMQTALDSTALMLSKEAATDTTDQLQSSATKYFKALFAPPGVSNIGVNVSYTNSGGSAVVLNGHADVPTTFMNVFGFQNITVTNASTSKWGSVRLRVALVLDNTGSMADDGKMTALKTATKNLLAQLQSAASSAGDVYVSIIPFSKDVNVGSGYYDQTWIDWTSWNAANQNCTWNWNGWTWTSTCTTKSHNTWNGCVTDRNKTQVPNTTYAYDQSAENPDPAKPDSLFVAEQYSSCPVAMMGLNYDWTTMNNLVDSMTPNGNTNQPIGLVWGWQSLVGGGPLTAPLTSSDYTYQKIIILLSDGLNTQDRWYSSQTSIDNRMLASDGTGTCANIKAAGITIYAIQVNTAGDATSTLLQNCASDTSKFWMLTSSGQIATTFQQIGTNLTQLRVAQ